MNIGIVTAWCEMGATHVSKAYLDVLAADNACYIYARGGHFYDHTLATKWDVPVTYAPRFTSYLKSGNSLISTTHLDRWVRQHQIELLIVNEQRDIRAITRVGDLGVVTGAYIDYYTRDTVDDFRHYDFLLCNTQRHASVFAHLPHTLYVPWGTDTQLFTPRHAERYAVEGVHFFHNAGWGSLRGRKGTDVLVQAFQQVQGTATLLIHSQSPLEAYGSLAPLITADPRIVFIHDTVPAPGLYHLGDVYVYPSRLDGIGLSVPEALACGLPTLTTNCPPMSEFVEEGYNGFLVDVAEYRPRSDQYYWPEAYVDPQDLTAKMQRYVDEPALLARHQAQAREYAVRKLDWRTNAGTLSTTLQGIVQSMKKPQRTAKPGDRLRWMCEDALYHSQHALYVLLGGHRGRQLLSSLRRGRR